MFWDLSWVSRDLLRGFGRTSCVGKCVIQWNSAEEDVEREQVDLMTAVNGLWWCLTESSEVGESPTSELCNQVKCSCTAPQHLHDIWIQLHDSCVEATIRLRGLRE